MKVLELPPTFDPSAIERTIYQRWLDDAVFTANRDSGRDPYVIVIPPPNVTDVLHMGHGLNNTLQDVLIRFERMRGREACWLPGTDHAGIATQNVVERKIAREEGLTRHQVGRKNFEERVWTHVKATGHTILEQLKAIGASCDWSRTRFTLDDQYSRAVRKVFVTLYNDGLLYRGHRVIHWCPRCATSLSDEEAEFHDRDGKLYHIRYRLTDRDGPYVVVATTRPETMFGDVCLVFHPDDDRFSAMDGGTALIPLSDVSIPIGTSHRVERDFGTGMLKVTPAHDANDFDIANESTLDLERPVVIDEEARMTQSERVPEGLRGLDREEARTKTVEMLKAADLLEKVEPYQHRVRQCYRCHTVVEPLLSDQWFVRMKPLAEPALEAYRQGEIKFVPERWGKVYENWLVEIRDWNISRQLWWGHRIPAWYCTDKRCGRTIVSEEAPAVCECGAALRQDEDVLDTWFSSWLWPFATFGWPEETPDLQRFYPGHTMVTGPDIIFFWVARMIMSGFHFMGKKPFETVYLNGIVRDTQNRKMSKSLGNGIDPLEVVQRYGADALRYTVIAGSATGADVLLDPDDLDTSFAVGRNFANKLWNIGRFILSHVAGAATNPLPGSGDLELADRWIMSRTQRAIAETTAGLAAFRFSEAANTIYHFLWDEVADWYVEQAKPRLSNKTPSGSVARGVLIHVFETSLRLLHPLMPFITEELWSYLPGEREALLAKATWPGARPEWSDNPAEQQFAIVQSLIAAVRSIRSEYHVSPGVRVDALVTPSGKDVQEAFSAELQTIRLLAKLEKLDLSGREPNGAGGTAVLGDGSTVFIPLGEAIDVAKECARLSAERDRLADQLEKVRAKLTNEKFTRRAPPEVVERERQKEKGWTEQRDTLTAKLQSLGC
jgi:valyl-tRNA synthetase